MTIAELITKLSKYPPDTRVALYAPEGGVDDIQGIDLQEICLNQNDPDDWWSGRHVEATHGMTADEVAVILRW